MNLVNAVKRCVASAKPELVTASKIVAVAAPLLLATGAKAALTLDSTEIVSTISDAVTVISAIGVAVLSLVVTIKVFKWVQRVL